MVNQLSLCFEENNKFAYQTYLHNDCKTHPCLVTSQGALFEEDCLKILPNIQSESIDLVFEDSSADCQNSKYGSNSSKLPILSVRYCAKFRQGTTKNPARMICFLIKRHSLFRER